MENEKQRIRMQNQVIMPNNKPAHGTKLVSYKTLLREQRAKIAYEQLIKSERIRKREETSQTIKTAFSTTKKGFGTAVNTTRQGVVATKSGLTNVKERINKTKGAKSFKEKTSKFFKNSIYG